MNDLRYRFILIFLFLGLWGGQNCYAQIQAPSQALDSIYQSFRDQPEDTLKVQALLDIALKAYKSGELALAIAYADESLNLSKDLDYDIGVAESYFIQARANNKQNKAASALKLFDRSQKIFQQLSRKDRLASLYNNVGIIYRDLGRYSNAVDFLSKSLEYYIATDHKLGIASSSVNLGSVYRNLAIFDKSAEAYFRALEVFEELNHKIGVAKANTNLANLFIDQRNYEKALKYSKNSLEIYYQLDQKQEIANQLSNLVSVYMGLGHTDSAFIVTNKADSLYRILQNDVGLAFNQNKTGDILVTLEQYDEALAAYEQSLSLFQGLKREGNIPDVLSNIGYVLMLKGRLKESLKQYTGSLEAANKTGVLDAKILTLERLSELYERSGEYTESLKFYKKYTALRDSVYNAEKERQLAYLEESYEIEKREKENDLLRQEQATQSEVIKRQNLQVKVLVGGLITFLLFAIYYYHINQQKKRTNDLLSQQNEEINQKQKEIISANQSLQLSEQQLHKANQELQTVNARLESTVKKRTSELQRTNHELDTFLYQSSHALRRPIVHVKGLVQLARIEPDQDEVEGLYDKLDDTATRMDLMLKKLVMASEIYVTEPEVETIYFEDIIKEVWDSLTDTLKVQTVKLDYTIPDDIQFKADRKLIKIMFLNLLENAIFYNEATKRKKAVVTISLASNPKSLDIKVNDNGIGISEEAIASIFDLFAVGTDKTKGYGLGLYIVKKAVEKLQGVITVSSKRNEYTTFHITLPKEIDNAF